MTPPGPQHRPVTTKKGEKTKFEKPETVDEYLLLSIGHTGSCSSSSGSSSVAVTVAVAVAVAAAAVAVAIGQHRKASAKETFVIHIHLAVLTGWSKKSGVDRVTRMKNLAKPEQNLIKCSNT